MKKIILLTLACLAINLQANIFYNVKDFGAKGDGIHIDSDAINEAIKSASANGGGTVFFPAGTYASFSIRLASNITLYLDAGSTILAAYPEKGRGYAPENGRSARGAYDEGVSVPAFRRPETEGHDCHGTCM